MSLKIIPYKEIKTQTYKMGRILIDSACTIEGDGIDVTTIEMTEDILFDIVMNEDAHVTIRDLTIVLKNGKAKSAIRYNGSSQADHHPNVSLIADRLSPRMTLQNVNIEAKGSATFENAIHVINGLGINMFNVSLNQKDRVRKGTAIRIEGEYQPVAFNIESCRILNFGTAIKTQDAEGLKIFGCNIVANTIGVHVDNINQQPEVNISDNHISSDLHNVYLKKANNVKISGNLFFRREGGLAKLKSSSVLLRDCKASIVSNNHFTSPWKHVHKRHCGRVLIADNLHNVKGTEVYDDSDKFPLKN